MWGVGRGVPREVSHWNVECENGGNGLETNKGARGTESAGKHENFQSDGWVKTFNRARGANVTGRDGGCGHKCPGGIYIYITP